jgi:hypothetical protein
MAREESRGWAETAIAGLQVRGDGVAAIRLLGWECVLPLSVVRTVVVAPMGGWPPVPTPMTVPGVEAATPPVALEQQAR